MKLVFDEEETHIQIAQSGKPNVGFSKCVRQNQ
jgi:hypothetical protein